MTSQPLTKADPDPVYTTREQWLMAAVDLIRPLFLDVGFKVPDVRVSCGWPVTGGASKTRRRVGECWGAEQAKDGRNHIFISPYLDEPIEAMEVDGERVSTGILETLTHELCHAVDNCENGHKGAYKRIAVAVGLTGRMTSTVAGEDLTAAFEEMVDELGPYPHGRIDMTTRKKQSTRMKKLECPECGYIARTTRKWLEVGVPTCPCGVEMEPEMDEEEAA